MKLEELKMIIEERLINAPELEKGPKTLEEIKKKYFKEGGKKKTKKIRKTRKRTRKKKKRKKTRKKRRKKRKKTRRRK